MDHERSFKLLYVDCQCPKCDKRIILGLSEEVKKYGFLCPYCKMITHADKMWDVVIKHRINKDKN